MKRNLIILLSIFLAAVAAFVYFTKDDVTFSKETSMYNAVPISAPAFVEFNSLKSIPLDNSVLKEWNEKEGASLLRWVEKLDTLIKNEKGIQNSLRNESFILAFDFVGEKDVFPLIIMATENKGKRKVMENLLAILFPSNNYSYEEIDYNKQKITSIKSTQNENLIHYCFTEGLFLMSSKLLLVEQSIRQLNTQSITINSFFSKVNKTVSSQSDISWYINHASIPDLMTIWINGQSVKKTNEFGETVRENYQNKSKDFGKYAAWSELDIEFKDNDILFNGISAADDSLNHFLSVFKGQEPVRFQADAVLPKNTSFFTSFSFSNKALFFENLEKYFAHTYSYYKREDLIKKMESGFRIDFKQNFQDLVKNEIIVATTSIPAESENRTSLFILQTNSKTDAESQINSFLSSYSQKKEIDFNGLKSSFLVDKETRFTVYQFPYPSFPGIWLGNPFGFVEAKFAAFNGNYLVFCNSEKGLKEYLQNMVLGATLEKDIRYLKFKQNIVNKSNINSYLNVNRSFSLNKEIFNKEVAKTLMENETYFRKFQAINWQMICEKEIYFNSIYLAFNQDIQEEAQTTWQSNVGESVVGKPQIVINHTDAENQEIILQDAKNNLHQLTNKGRPRWSVSINEPILSEIHQIDYFRNGKLQYLFNTKSKLYLIDRDGKNVAHFPVSFRAPATNGVSVFDYDNNRKYRYFVACENKKVYALDTDGKILSGWNFGQTDDMVSTPIQHFRVNNKDYIVFKDKSRIYIQNRKGETRVTTMAKFENSENLLILNLNGVPKIVATDKNGNVFYIYFDGKFTEKKTGNFGENHFFTIDDLDGNGIPDFVFVDGNELTVMDENGKKLFSEKFKNTIQLKPNIYSFGAKNNKIGIVDSEGNRIYLYDASGDLHEGFPLHGNTEFSIGSTSQSSNQLNLIVGSKGGDLYNYTLN